MEGLTLRTDVVAVGETGRRTHDAYFTSQPLANALIERLALDGFWKGGRFLEPSAGRGAFINAINTTTPKPDLVHAVDVDPIRIEELRNTVEADNLRRCDFVEVGNEYELIAGNPPYSHAEAHARHALGLRSRFGAVAFLLRLGFLESKDRLAFWRQHPASKIYVLSQRPSFTGGGTDNSAYGWFVWASWHRGPTEMEVISWR